MVLETITLKELVAYMDEGNIFSLGGRTFNDKLQTGGEWIAYENCVKHNHLTSQELKEKANKPKEIKSFKNPNHYQNATRNIKIVDTGELVKVHLRLIRIFNNKTVL